MKKLKYYKSFLEELQTIPSEYSDNNTQQLSKQELNNYIKLVNDFKIKKNSIDKMLADAEKNNKDVSKDVAKIVGDNVYLNAYVNVATMNIKLNKMDGKVKYYTEQINAKNKELSDANQLLDQEDKAGEIETINNLISGYKKKISDMQKSMVEMKQEIAKKQKEIQDKIKKDGDEIKKRSTQI